MTRVRRTIACVGVLLCLGCSEERPTRPVGQICLRAMNLSDNPIAEISDSIAGVAVNDSEFVIHLGGISMVDHQRADDIQISFDFGRQSRATDPSVFDRTTGTWLRLNGTEFWSRRYLTCPPCTSWMGFRTLKEEASPVGRFVNVVGELFVTAVQTITVSAKVFTYRPDFQFVSSPLVPDNKLTPMAFGGQRLWIIRRACDECSDAAPKFEHFVELSEDGTVTRSDSLLSRSIGSLAYGDGEFWGLWWDGNYKISTIDAQRAFGSTFVVVPPEGWYARSLAWAQRSLWLLTMKYGPAPWSSDSLFQIDIPTSIATGSAQVIRRLEISRSRGMPYITGQNDHILFADDLPRGQGPFLLRYDTLGSLIDSLSLPIAPASGMAWDGKALWMLHHGPSEAYTDATLMSRFYIR